MVERKEKAANKLIKTLIPMQLCIPFLIQRFDVSLDGLNVIHYVTFP